MKTLLRKYETIIVTKPNLNSEDQEKLKSKYLSIIQQFKGRDIRFETWGKIRLSYPIKKHTKAIYFYLSYLAPQNFVQEFERSLKLMEPVLRFFTVKLMDNVDPDTYDFEKERAVLLYKEKEEVEGVSEIGKVEFEEEDLEHHETIE